jgi:hypothetical protein
MLRDLRGRVGWLRHLTHMRAAQEMSWH